MSEGLPRPVFRFAPSPNGRLHLGHACSALLNAHLAERMGGRLLLRIEDIDPVRSRPELIAAIGADLAWLGIEFEDGPWRQSARLPVYERAIETLAERRLAYPCFCSRGQIAKRVAAQEESGVAVPRDPDGTPHYPGTCRALPLAEVEARRAAGEAHAWRLDMARALGAEPGPQVYRRFEARPSLSVPLAPLAGRGPDAARPASGVRRRSRSEGEGASPDEPHPGTPPHLRLPPGSVRRQVGMEPSPRVRGEVHARNPIEIGTTLTIEEIAADPARWGDVVLARRDVPTSYHLAVVIDDDAQSVTHVVRGQDLEAATDLHVLLQRLLGLTSPIYHHHALVNAPDGEKLAKSKGSESLADLRARGVSAREVRAILGFQSRTG